MTFSVLAVAGGSSSRASERSGNHIVADLNWCNPREEMRFFCGLPSARFVEA
jgi:hypothetical protein